MTTMVEIWKSLTDWALVNAPHLLNSLDINNIDQLIDTAKNSVGHQDSQLWSLHQLIDGNKSGGLVYPIPGLRILPLNELIKTVEMWRDLSIEQDYTDSIGGQDGVEVVQSGLVRTEYALWDHIPFAADGAGNYLALDFAPGPLGTVGQVINIGAGEDRRYVITRDLIGLFELILSLLKDGSFALNVNDKDKNLYCFEPDCYLFLDALPKLYDLNLLARPTQ